MLHRGQIWPFGGGIGAVSLVGWVGSGRSAREGVGAGVLLLRFFEGVGGFPMGCFLGGGDLFQWLRHALPVAVWFSGCCVHLAPGDPYYCSVPV